MPEFAQPWVSLGQVQMNQGKYSDAIQSFSNALQKSQSADAFRGTVGSYYALNQPQQAMNTIQQARRVFPQNPMFREMELQHELRYGDPEKAIAPRQEMLKQAIDSKDPKEQTIWQTLGMTYMAAAKSKTNENESRALLEKARDTFAQASAKWPNDVTFVQYYADVCVQLHDNAGAEKAIQALRARPSMQGKPEPTILLASYYNQVNQLADQEKVLREYLAASPQTVNVRIQLASLLASEKKLDDALKILDSTSEDPDIRKARIDLQIDAGRLADAEKEMRGLLDRTPNPSVSLLIEQSYIYMKSGRSNEALPILEKILADDAHQPDALLYRGTIYAASMRNLDQAVRDLQEVRDSGSPASSEARLILVDAFHFKGDDDSAIRELEAMVRLNPADEKARVQLASYYSRATPPRWVDMEFTLNDALKQPELAVQRKLLHA